MVEMLSASVALSLWEIAAVIRVKVSRNLSEIKQISFLSRSKVRLTSLRIQEKEKESMKHFTILTSIGYLILN